MTPAAWSKLLRGRAQGIRIEALRDLCDTLDLGLLATALDVTFSLAPKGK